MITTKKSLLRLKPRMDPCFFLAARIREVTKVGYFSKKQKICSYVVVIVNISEIFGTAFRFIVLFPFFISKSKFEEGNLSY